MSSHKLLLILTRLTPLIISRQELFKCALKKDLAIKKAAETFSARAGYV
jgi:hypothetical protein